MKTLSYYKSILENESLVVRDNSEKADFGVAVEYISYNSQDILDNTLFICKGINFKNEYLKDSLTKGANCFVCEEGSILPESFPDTPFIVVNDMRKSISKISSSYFGYSWNDLKIIGITGTKGKSTASTMLKNILDIHNGREIGFSSGIYTYDGIKRTNSKLTTPETIELHKLLDSAAKQDTKYFIVEVSSQALKYGRVMDISFDYGAFLNFSKDHISPIEHPTLEDYFNSKLKIFDQSKTALINPEMKEIKEIEEYISHSDVERVLPFKKAFDIVEHPASLEFKTDIYGKEENITVGIGGGYNVSNAVLAITIAEDIGVSVENIKAGLENLVVTGRMEHYRIGNNVDIIIDAAHNKLSYEGLFDYARKNYPGRKIGFLFGCVGDKAFNRRKEAGEIASANADFIVITERDPGKEPVEKICNEIYENIEHKEKAEIIVNRDEAVSHILEKAEEMGNCVLLLCGCGSATYVKRGTAFVETVTDGDRVREYQLNHK